jgi:hypothetical protein
MEDMPLAMRPSTTSGGAAGEIDKKPLTDDMGLAHHQLSLTAQLQ